MLSPFSKIRPSAFRLTTPPFAFALLSTSSAASRTRFMYSSKPCRVKEGEGSVVIKMNYERGGAALR